MGTKIADPPAPVRYAAAHDLHYREGDLLGAIEGYDAVIARDPDSAEARYAATQICSLAQQYVAAPQLVGALVELLRARGAVPRPTGPSAGRS